MRSQYRTRIVLQFSTLKSVAALIGCAIVLLTCAACAPATAAAASDAAGIYGEELEHAKPYAGNGLTPPEYIDAMYAAGARGTFDTIAIHPYAPDVAGVMEILRRTRQQLDVLGDPDRPIWATEFGWATGGPPVTITATEPVQANLLRRSRELRVTARDGSARATRLLPLNTRHRPESSR